jgi:hypothetical protein
MAWLARLFDSGDRSVEAHIVLAAVGVLAFVGLAAYGVMWLGQHFDPAAYGQGLGLAFAGSGAAAWGQGAQRRAEK